MVSGSNPGVDQAGCMFRGGKTADVYLGEITPVAVNCFERAKTRRSPVVKLMPALLEAV